MRPKIERWFLLRGLVREAAHWGNFPNLLSQAMPEADVFCLDVPGNGRYWNRPSPLTIAEGVDALRGEFDEIIASDPTRPNYLVAISLGGMLAVDWLSRFPNDIRAAVLINTSLGGISPVYHRLSLQALPTLGKIFLERDSMKRERLILDLTSRLPDPKQLKQVALERARVFEERPVSRWNAMRQLASAARYRAPEKPPAVPMLVLSSLADAMVSPECSRELAKRWQLPIIQHPTAGHDLPLDDPAWVVTQIQQWSSHRQSGAK